MSRAACSVLRLREKMANPFLPNRVGSKCDCTYWKTSEHITLKQPFETSPFKVFKEFCFVSIYMLRDQYFIFLSQLDAHPHAGIIPFSPSLWSPLTLSPTLPFFIMPDVGPGLCVSRRKDWTISGVLHWTRAVSHHELFRIWPERKGCTCVCVYVCVFLAFHM